MGGLAYYLIFSRFTILPHLRKLQQAPFCLLQWVDFLFSKSIHGQRIVFGSWQQVETQVLLSAEPVPCPFCLAPQAWPSRYSQDRAQIQNQLIT